ncbi:MAG: tetratricopeptide repeat protein [Acidobacteria bacterium]|nr:tetratricopeptide repeat protein [Acidobacteriota bacterium]
MKRECSRCVVAAIAVFSLLALALPAWAQQGAIQVTCLDGSGNALKDVKVVIINLLTNKSKDEKSNGQGIASFDKLEDAVYRVVGRKEGFAPGFHELVEVRGASAPVTLKLEAGADRKLHFEDPLLEKNAAALLQQGLGAYQQNNLPEAEKIFRQSLEINPSSAEGLYYLGATLLRQSRFDDAAETWKKAEAAAGVLKKLPSKTPAGQPNPYETIEQNVRQQLQQMPIFKAESAFKAKKYEEAAVLYAEAAKAFPTNPDLHANRARALTQAMKWDEAIAAVDRALELKTGDASLAGLRKTIVGMKENEAIQKAQGLLNAGNKMLGSDDASGALGKYEEANTLIAAERQAPIWRQIGRALAKLERRDEAEAAFRKSIELAPEGSLAEYQMAFAQFYLDGKKFEQAVDVMADPRSAGDRSPEQVLVDLAERVKNQEPRLAEAALERVIQLNPANANAYYDLGRLYFAEGKEKDARTLELLNKFVEIGTDQAKLEDAKGLLYVVSKRSQ